MPTPLDEINAHLAALRRERSASVVTLRRCTSDRQRKHWLARIAGLDHEIGRAADSLAGSITGGDGDRDDAR